MQLEFKKNEVTEKGENYFYFNFKISEIIEEIPNNLGFLSEIALLLLLKSIISDFPNTETETSEPKTDEE